jgi:hypothetical protein
MEIGPFIPLTSDYGFKATFGNEGNTLFLRTALQALIKSAVPIREVQLEKNAFEALTLDSRSGTSTWPAPMRRAAISSWRCSWGTRRISCSA